MALAKGDPVLSMHGIVKTFGGVRALDGANLEVEAGNIQGLVGQNGAGKSTLIKILAGIHRPDAGSITIRGLHCPHLTPRQVEHLGIHFIHQDRLLVPTFTVGEAMFLGAEPGIGRLPFLNRREMARQATTILRDHFDVRLAGGALISELTPAERQIVQISRALLRDPAILVFDEPTAALVRREVDRLFEIIRRLQAKGITIVYISHYLSEIESLCDQVTVLRNGVDVGHVSLKSSSTTEIVSLMLNRDIDEMFPKRAVPIGEPVLKLNEVSARGAFNEISLTLHRGEILGLTGLLGSGAKELVQSLFGLVRLHGGTIEIGSERTKVSSPPSAVSKKLALVPEDRRAHGVALQMSVRENVTLASLQRFVCFGFLQPGREKTATNELIRKLSIHTASQASPVGDLSGGNQQKVVLAKWLSRQSALYLLDEPTVGVDVGAKVEIYRLIGELAEQGAGILLLSSDLLELLGIADRILVMYRGQLAGEFNPANSTSADLLSCATGTSAVSEYVNAVSAESGR
ncbi:MAG: sugar ABC transporter ATP-binding protein [Verrucomicrobia bacterium]|nr:sugar ABC transporter ATP-binding protein [Verrucomicrobiota bacterium]MBV8279966.1 sugar ABC transporter ATP-binding protein [Verrucomicrobiota bacterium]